MTDATLTLKNRVFAKTEAGQSEIKTRSLGLSPKLRSVLIMVDGQRTGRDLAALAGPDTEQALAGLMAAGCIEMLAAAPEPAAAPEAEVTPLAQDELAGLPPAASRNPKQVEMARNFMTNTINTMFGQNMRLTLIEAIFNCHSADDLRWVYPQWVEAMASSRPSAKRLPELQAKLFEVL